MDLPEMTLPGFFRGKIARERGVAFLSTLLFFLSLSPFSAYAFPQSVRIPPDVIRTLGIKTKIVSLESGFRVIRSNGTVALIDDRIRYVTARSIHRLTIFGYIRNVYADTGDLVLKGQVLVTVFSPDYIEAQQEYLQAIRLEKINENHASTRTFSPRILEAAISRLKNLGVIDREIKILEKSGVVHRHLKIRAPISGYVLKKNVVSGQSVNSGDRLFVIGNMDWVRVNAQIYQQNVHSLALGETMKVHLPESQEVLSGRVVYISPMTDPKTRTVTVRGIFFNNPIRLRPGMFLPVETLVPSGKHEIWIPREAVFLDAGRKIVFLQKGTDTFLLREVRVGHAEGGLVSVFNGVSPGDRLVVVNGFWVKAQFERQK